MEGFINHLIVENDKIERELERDLLNVEVPYLADEYKKWMLEVDDKKGKVPDTYVSNIKSADREFFLYEDDFFYLLPQKIKSEDYDGVASLFKQYALIIDEWYEDSKKEDVGISTKTIRDWRSAFRNYKKFINDRMISETIDHLDGTDNSAAIKVPKCRRLFAEEEFRTWLVDNGVPGEGSINSYVARLRRVNKNVPRILTTTVTNPADALHTFIANNLKDEKGYAACDFLNKLIDRIKQLIATQDESLMPLNALRDCNASLRKYRKFILDKYIVEIPDEEEEQEIEIVNTPAVTDATDETSTKIEYDYEEIMDNFQFRLFTQNRMSKNKDVFFPIGIIRQLFYKSERKSRVAGASNGYYKWLLKWASNCIAEINIKTDKGNITLGELTEDAALTLNPGTKDIVVNRMDTEESAHLMTDTDKEGEAPVPMRVNRLSDIHIDHTPLMCQVLSDNISQLPALVRLTEMIRTTANENKIDITTKNFTKIGKKVISNADRFAEMENLIPALKQELELIRKASTLQLMAAEYNLKKKK